MQRCSFLAAAVTSAATVSPLGHHVGRVLHGDGNKRPSNRSSQRPPRGVLVCVRLSDVKSGWYPKSWREVPPPPFEICSTVDAGQSLAACRTAAKKYNNSQLKAGVCSWLIVVATDARRRARKAVCV